MKITPAKDYKKPVYAIGVAATVMTLAVSGCTAPASKSKDKITFNICECPATNNCGGLAKSVERTE